MWVFGPAEGRPEITEAERFMNYPATHHQGGDQDVLASFQPAKTVSQNIWSPDFLRQTWKKKTFQEYSWNKRKTTLTDYQTHTHTHTTDQYNVLIQTGERDHVHVDIGGRQTSDVG